MNIDQNKLDELFSEEESAAAESRAKSKVRAKAKVKPEEKPEIKLNVPEPEEEEQIPDEEKADEPAAPVSDAADDAVSDASDTSDASAIPDEEKEVIKLNPGKVTNTVFDWIGSLLIALVCVLLVMSFCFRVIDVDGTSMEPTLIDTDKVIITDLFYTPKNGDIIVISHGEDYPKPLVKRVIALPGQDLRIDFDKNEVYVDGVKLDETYALGATVRGDKSVEEINGIIPEGKLFVMGDNREVSLDSRSKSVGLIDIDSVIGKAQLDIIPHSREEGTIKLDLSRIRYLYD